MFGFFLSPDHSHRSEDTQKEQEANFGKLKGLATAAILEARNDVKKKKKKNSLVFEYSERRI